MGTSEVGGRGLLRRTARAGFNREILAGRLRVGDALAGELAAVRHFAGPEAP